MISNKIFNNKGLTLVELLVVIGILATLAALFIVSIKTTTNQYFTRDADNLANDMRYIRNLNISRAVYNGTYPGAYGIKITNGNGTTISSSYILYAGSSSNIIKSVTLSDPSFRIGDFNNNTSISDATWVGDLKFVDESKIEVNKITINPIGQYQLFLQYPVTNGYNRAVLLLGQKSGDNFVWANIGYDIAFAPSFCGNGFVDPGEQCDDGNTIKDDGCYFCKLPKIGSGGHIDPCFTDPDGVGC